MQGAIDRFTPEDRDCYTAEEVNLVSLPLKKGYREENSSDDISMPLKKFESAFVWEESGSLKKGLGEKESTCIMLQTNQ